MWVSHVSKPLGVLFLHSPTSCTTYTASIPTDHLLSIFLTPQPPVIYAPRPHRIRFERVFLFSYTNLSTVRKEGFLSRGVLDVKRVLCNRCNKMALDNLLLSFYGRDMRVYLNASEVAKLLNVDRATVTRWIKKGVIKGVQRPTSTQQWRIPMSSYEDLIKYRESR